MPRESTNSRIVPPGCRSGLLLRDADLPPVQLERSRRFVGVCVSGGHTGFSGLHRWEPDPGHPQSPPPIAHTTPTQVRTAFGVCVCVLPVCLDGKSIANLLHNLQGDQPRPWIEAGRGDAHHLSEAHREHRPHLLRVLYRLWHFGSAGASSHKSTFALNKLLRTRRDALLQFKETL